jgi:hypothetical protein
VVRTVRIGEWGSLVVYDLDEEPPDGLHGFDDFWRGDDHRSAVLLRTGRGPLPYVAVWPSDGPPPSTGPLTERDLEGVALTSPVAHHVCAACGAVVSGLYADAGVAFFPPRDRTHDGTKEGPGHVDKRLTPITAPLLASRRRSKGGSRYSVCAVGGSSELRASESGTSLQTSWSSREESNQTSS